MLVILELEEMDREPGGERWPEWAHCQSGGHRSGDWLKMVMVSDVVMMVMKVME